jgi:seryl-tRNA synthetase
LNDLIEKQLPGVPLPSKNAIRRAINKVNSEISIIEKIISGLKEIYAVSAENEETNTVIETLDKELEDIGSSVDSIIVMAEQHLEERLGNGETDSVLTSLRSQETSPQSPVMSKKSSGIPLMRMKERRLNWRRNMEGKDVYR